LYEFYHSFARIIVHPVEGRRMGSLTELLEEYDRLGSEGSAHDFMLRQRRLEDWAVKARDAIAALARTGSGAQLEDGDPAVPRSRAPTQL
jgi:hypothetical protein